MKQKVRVAIIEDNATARATIRSHLISLGNLEISSFSTGSELKAVLKKQNFELLCFDFHLGQKRNGVEWVQALRQSEFILPSTGIVFITADRLPQVIGQIIDIHPDLLLIKPYTISSLQRGVKHYLEFREVAKGAFEYLDNKHLDKSIKHLIKLVKTTKTQRIKSDLEKLLARLLMQQGNYHMALTIYDSVLTHSDKILWAQWGRLKCHYLMGKWPDCQDTLDSMVDTVLTRDKAFEWLACLSFEQDAFEKAEYYLDHIQDSDLSLPATRLKSMTYQKQNRILESIDLLQKKREYNRSVKERFDEFTFELAEFYLSIAQSSPHSNRDESLSQARKLVGVAARNHGDLQIRQRHDFLLAYSYVLEEQLAKARELTQREHMANFKRSNANTLLTAARVFSSLGNTNQASFLFDMAREKSELGEMPAEQQTLKSKMVTAEIETGLAEQRAEHFNDNGLALFTKKAFTEAMEAFYEALLLAPNTTVYAINLLQTLLLAKQDTYRSASIRQLSQSLFTRSLSEANKQRFMHLRKEFPIIEQQISTQAPLN